MPECNFYARNQWCQNGEECLYLHVDDDTRLGPCPHYDKGFCPLGARCSKKHIRRELCKFYLAGFCPHGKQCAEGAHPRWPASLDPPTVMVKRDPAEVERERQLKREQAEREEEQEREKDRSSGGRRDWRRPNRGYRNRRNFDNRDR
jgi:cleavage and polyadenylation specificity factor subunit 4